MAAAAVSEPRDGVKTGTRAVPSCQLTESGSSYTAVFLNGSRFRSHNLFYISPITSNNQYVQKIASVFSLCHYNPR